MYNEDLITNMFHKISQRIKFKFYLEGIEESKIKEFEELEEKEFDSEYDGDVLELIDFFKVYWREWWKKNSNDFWDYMVEKHDMHKIYEKELVFNSLEENQIVRESNKYKIIYDYKTVSNTKIVINISIVRISDEETNDDLQYDIDLENIKIDIKNFWLKVLNQRKTEIGQDIVNCRCIWIEDTQSLDLSNKAYREINLIENYLRNFMNDVMLIRNGMNWQEIFKRTSIGNKFISRKPNYRSSIKSFSDIDDFLLLIDSDDLYKIMNYQRKKVVVNSDEEDLSILIDEIKDVEKPDLYIKKVRDLVNKIDNKYTVKSKSIWNFYFSDLFDIKDKNEEVNNVNENLQSNFRDEWNKLCKFRNHVAHNKFIDINFYTELNNLIKKIKDEIDEAQKEFYSIVENENIHFDLFDDIEFINKKDREKIIHNLLIKFVQDIIEECKSKGVEVIASSGFRLYGKDSEAYENEFIMYIKETWKKATEIEIIRLEMHDKIELMLTRKRGELTSFVVEFLVNNECIYKTEISHSGYSFYCDGYPEIQGDDRNSEYYRMVMGESWDFWNEFKRNVKDIISDYLDNSN